MTHTQQQCDCVCGWAAVSLRDDFRAYLPELLPRFIGLFAEAERSGNYDQVPAALHALEALGGALEDHLQLLLPALVRLICIGKKTQNCGTYSAVFHGCKSSHGKEVAVHLGLCLHVVAEGRGGETRG